MSSIIVDTSALYALVDRKDPNHGRAAAYLGSVTTARSLIVSNHIFDESMTLVKMRLGMAAALQLGMRLRNSRLIEMIIFGPAEEQSVWRIFTQFQDKEWSYTDCACLALAQQRKTDVAFTFDHHFRQMGLHMEPA
jgi:predicted nucleic acid-binding protein